MRFSKMTWRGLGPFRAPAEVDLDSIPGLVIAVCGDNGAGKSTLLELLPGALYRTTPTRGSLVELATERAAFVEARVVNGAMYTLRHTIDAASGKGESVVLDAGGEPVLQSAKVRDFDAWRAVHLPSPEVLYASSFAAQGSGGFLEMKAGDRKGVLLRVLGIEELEQKAESARERQRSARQALEVLGARIADERERGGDLAQAEEQITRARAEATEADRALERARADLAEIDRRIAELEKAKAEVERVRALRRDHDEAVKAAEKRVADLEVRCANNRMVLTKRAEIEAAVRRDAELDALLEARRTELAQGEQDLVAAKKDADAARAQASRADLQKHAAESRREGHKARLAQAARRLADRDSVAAAAGRLQELRLAVEAATELEAEAHKQLEETRAASLGVAEKRIAVLRPALEEIANLDERHDAITDLACDAIYGDDQIVRAAAAAPTEAAAATNRLRCAVESLRLARHELDGAQALAARAGEIEQAAADKDAAAAELAASEKEVAEAAAESQRANEELLGAGQRSADAADRCRILLQGIDAAEAERAKLATTVARAAPLAQAEARLGELEPELVKAQAEVQRLVASTPPPAPELPEGDVDRDFVLTMVSTAEQRARHAHSMISVAEARLESAKLAKRKLEELGAERRTAEQDLADWVLLAESLGRDGIQALEVDAAGPELTALINDLLQTCVGSRWTVSIETTKASADGKKQLEGCEVRVLDVERGRDASAETLSGGERVLVGEAVSLALSMLACRRAGVDGPTLVRDESGAALDPANARGYVSMLRRAAQVIGASHVLFVSHSKEVQELADARIDIANGQVTVAA